MKRTPKKFAWKEGARVKIDANVAGIALERIERKHGKITPDIVLREATQKQHPLHDYFEWDNSKAARAWRIEQASYLVRSIEVIVEEEDRPTPARAFVSIEKPDGERGYHNLDAVMRDSDMREQMLERARRELSEWRRRYDGLVELAKVYQAIDAVEKAA